MDIVLFYMAVAAACILLYTLAYRSLKAPFFLYLSIAAIFIACTSIAVFIPDGGALSDLSLALCGASMAVASLQLGCSFRLAGDSHD